jgi:hypothetical protein
MHYDAVVSSKGSSDFLFRKIIDSPLLNFKPLKSGWK